MFLLIGGVDGADERLMDSKLLEHLRSDVASWHGGRDGLHLKCGGVDYCRSAEDGAGSDRLKGGVALVPDPAMKRKGGILRLMLFIGVDPTLQDWWLSRLVNASWQ